MATTAKTPTAPPAAAKYRSTARSGNARGLSKSIDSNFTMLQAFEWYQPGGGVYWKEFEQRSKALGDMGITGAWLPPPTKASSQNGNGYDIYDLYDLGEFDQKGGQASKWGTKEQFLKAVKVARENGIVVYVDAVLNHKAGADEKEKFLVSEVEQEDRTVEKNGGELFDIEGYTKFTFPGRKEQYSDFKWNYNHFTGVDYDALSDRTSIFKIHGDGKDWSLNVDESEKGNFDYLMFADIDHEHPSVREDLLKWGVWVTEESGTNGFRFDAIKHIDERFINAFVNHVREKLDNPDLFCVGEFWHTDLGLLEGYLDRFDTQFSIFDTPLHYNFHEASQAGASYDLRTIFDGSLVQSRPTDAVTIVDNHDTQPGQALESWIDPGFKTLAYALILFRHEGYPCVFAGDLYGCSSGSDSEPKVEPMNQLEDYVRIRKLFAYGETRDYFDHANCLGWVREGDKDHDGCAVVICNGTGEGEKRMQIPDGHAGEIWTDVLGWSQGEITIGDDGWADFKCPAMSVSVWAKKDARGREEFGKK